MYLKGYNKLDLVHFYIDETKFVKNNKKYLGLSLVLIRDEKHIKKIEKELASLKHELAIDQYLGHDENDRLFHFTEDSAEIKPKLVDKIRDFNIRGYIAYNEFQDNGDFKNKYLEILFKLLNDRIVKYKHCEIHVFYEEQSEIKQKDVQFILDTISRKYNVKNISIQKATKANILLCLPDYLLGVFRDITDSTKKQFDYMRRNFEKFSNKIRLIIDMEEDVFYHKKNPYIKY